MNVRATSELTIRLAENLTPVRLRYRPGIAVLVLSVALVVLTGIALVFQDIRNPGSRILAGIDIISGWFTLTLLLLGISPYLSNVPIVRHRFVVALILQSVAVVAHLSELASDITIQTHASRCIEDSVAIQLAGALIVLFSVTYAGIQYHRELVHLVLTCGLISIGLMDIMCPDSSAPHYISSHLIPVLSLPFVLLLVKRIDL